MSVFVQQEGMICDFASYEPWVILTPIEQSIKRKIEVVGTPLKDWDIQIYRGVLTGCNDAFIISTEKRNEILANCQSEDERQRTEELIRPILRGRDIKRYAYDWANLYLIATFPACNYDIDKYPAIKQYLLSFAEKDLREAGYDWVADSYLADFCKQKLAQTGEFVEIEGKRITIGTTPEKARKKTNNQWFETQDSISYWEDFYRQKIVWGEISDRSKFAFDNNGIFVPEATTFLMIGEHLPYLLCILNSPLSEWFFSKIGTTTGVGTVRWKKFTIQELIIPKVSPQDEVFFTQKVKDLVNKTIDLKDFTHSVNKHLYSIVGLSNEEESYVENFYPPLL